jgi:hypothetical protein
MEQLDRRPRLGEPISRFQPQQSAADHHDGPLPRGQRQQEIDVAAVAERMHAGNIDAGQVKPEGRGARGKHQA